MNNARVKEIVEILMDTDIYFDLNLVERYSLIKNISSNYLTKESKLSRIMY